MLRKYYTWDDIYEMLDIIYDKVKDKGFKYVTGIPRGGLIPAVLFSHRFNEFEFMERPSNHYNNLLIFDDIADTGHTLEKIKPNFPNPSFATLHYKEMCTVEPDYYAKYIPIDYGWIVYPWELKSSKSIQDYLSNQK